MKLKLGSEKILLAVAFVSLILVCLPRFNGNQTWVQQTPWDAQYFNAYVQYFRGETPAAPIRPMSNCRFLLPLLAAPLPFAPDTSLNLINFFCIALSLYFLYAILKHIGVDPKQRWWAVFIGIFSFPTFYYACISYVDAGAILFVSMGVYAWLQKKYVVFSLVVLLGLLAKETSIVLFPFAMAWTIKEKQYRHLIILFFGLILFFFLHYLIQLYAPLTPGEMRFKPWQFNWGAAQNNLQRPHTLLSFLLSLGLPGVLLTRALIINKTNFFDSQLHFAALGGLFGVFALYVFSFLTTVADGRIIWHGYIFMFLLIFTQKRLTTKELRYEGNMFS
jgi:hypothetical protein